MFGGDLPTSDRRTIDLLTNRDVLAVLNESCGNRQERRDADLVIWTAEATDRPAHYLAVFAIGDCPLDVRLPLDPDLALVAGARAVELWTGSAVTLTDDLRVVLPTHGCALYRVEPATPRQ
jgi:hypothetical protein